jgi:hypothetical protein
LISFSSSVQGFRKSNKGREVTVIWTGLRQTHTGFSLAFYFRASFLIFVLVENSARFLVEFVLNLYVLLDTLVFVIIFLTILNSFYLEFGCSRYCSFGSNFFKGKPEQNLETWVWK